MKAQIKKSPKVYNVEALKKNPGKWFEKNVSKIRENRKVQAGFALTEDRERIFVKRYLLPRFWDRLASRLYNNKAETQLRISKLLVDAGINVPKPLKVFRDLSGRPPSVLYLCEGLYDCNSLRAVVHEMKHGDYQEIPSLMRRIAKMMARMHNLGFVHGDLKWTNILIAPSPGREFWFVDLDNATRSSFPKNNRYALDLARFAVDMAENLQDPQVFAVFLNCYKDYTGLKIQNLIKAMAPFFQKICLKHERKNKPGGVSLLSLAADVVNEDSVKIR